jgi:hypothetical protein
MRAGEEREAAIKATHPNARQCHIDLAKAYERRARGLSAVELSDDVHLVSAA